jgi:transcriptional regulator with XRE-family HTH domain
MTKKAELNTVGARIKEARTMAGLSQKQLAKLMKFHRPTISEIEADNRRVSATELARIAELLDVSVGWIVGEAPEATNENDPRVQLAARALRKLKPEDVKRLLQLFTALKE